MELIYFYPGDTNIYNFDSFVAASHDTEEGVYVAFHGETEGILIEDVSLADLSADDVDLRCETADLGALGCLADDRFHPARSFLIVGM